MPVAVRINRTRSVQTDPIGLVGGINTNLYLEEKLVFNVDSLGLEDYVYSRPLDGVRGILLVHFSSISLRC